MEKEGDMKIKINSFITQNFELTKEEESNSGRKRERESNRRALIVCPPYIASTDKQTEKERQLNRVLSHTYMLYFF